MSLLRLIWRGVLAVMGGAALLLVVGAVAVGLRLGLPRLLEVRSAPATPLTLEQLQEVAELLVLRIGVEQTLRRRIDGYSGGVEVLLAVHGEVSLGVDLGAGRLVEVDPDGRRATLILPPPQAMAPRVDHERTRVLHIGRSGLWRIAPTSRPEAAVQQQALLAAQQQIEQAGRSGQADARARAHAARVLSDFARSLGWSLQIRWASD